MTTRSAIDALRRRLRDLQDALRALCLALDDVPDAGDEPAIVDAMRSAASEIESDLEGALAADGGDARVALGCHDAVLRMQRTAREIASHANHLELARLAAERGRVWRRWSEVVREALEAFEETLHNVAEALLGVWRELVEHAAPPFGAK
jgi:hypothetical protein